MTTLQTIGAQGWYEINSDGQGTIYLALTEEGLTTGPSDTPANAQHIPRILNADNFSIRRVPLVWVHGDTSIQQAAFGNLELANYDGYFNNLLKYDIRDWTVVLKLPTAAMLTTGTTIRDTPTIATAVVDDCYLNEDDVVTIVLKDTLARLDRQLPCRFNKPFADSGAANNIIRMTFGACRNVPPLLVDTVNRLFELHDAPISNLAMLSDMAAPLDPTVPQYVPALNNSGVQLTTMPVGKLTAELSSVGQQAIISGANDVFSGAGAFPNPWIGTLTGAFSTTTSGAVITFGGTQYRVNATSVAGLNAGGGDYVYITDGVNSIAGPTLAVVGSNVRFNISAVISTGTPTSIAIGSPLRIAGVPTGFTFSNGVGSGIAESSLALFGGVNAVVMNSAIVLNPGTTYGDYLKVDTASFPAYSLLPGRSYRLTFGLYNVQAQSPFFTNGFIGGLVIATALSANEVDFITGSTTPLNTGAFGLRTYTFEFTVPGGSSRALYFIATPSSGNAPTNAQGVVTLTLFNVKLQLLGQFVELPLSGIEGDDYCTEILVHRAGESSSIFNSTEAAAIGLRDDGNLIPWGIHFDSAPNILDALRMWLDNYCATTWTDNLGVLRFGRFVNPADPTARPATSFDITPVNAQRPIRVRSDRARGLTTSGGCRRNWTQFGPSDFVTDQAIVPQDVKTRFSRKSQFQRTSSVSPAAQYSFAIFAPQFDTLMDEAEDLQNELDRITACFGYQVFKDGTVDNGKRRIVEVTVFFQDPSAIGVNTTCALSAIGYGTGCTLTYPAANGSAWFVATPAIVIAWEIFPARQEILLTLEV